MALLCAVNIAFAVVLWRSGDPAYRVQEMVALGRNAERARGQQEQIGRRLGMGDLRGREDAAFEEGQEASHTERELHLLVRALRANRERDVGPS